MVHHDRLKLSAQTKFPLWLRRKRHALLGKSHQQPKIPSTDTTTPSTSAAEHATACTNTAASSASVVEPSTLGTSRSTAVTEPCTSGVAAPFDQLDVSDGLSDSPTYCICRGPDNGRLMVCCDVCEEWFHCDCVKIIRKKSAVT